MDEFFRTLFDPEIASLRYALILGLLASVPFGMIGAHVVSQRITYLSAAIAHAVLGGIGISLFLRETLGWTQLPPLLGAAVFGILAALIIGWISLRGRERDDTVIGAILAVGMALGFLFLSRTPGYVDAMSYLAGDILIISRSDLWLVAALDAVVIVVGVIFYRQLAAVGFDRDFARLRGVPVNLFYLLLLCLVAITIVLLVSIVGIILVVALLTLPAAIAARFSTRLWQMMLGGVILCMIFVVCGLALSFQFAFPTGPTIIVLAGTAYLVVALTGLGREKG